MSPERSRWLACLEVTLFLAVLMTPASEIFQHILR
jgi:hypothetical protein